MNQNERDVKIVAATLRNIVWHRLEDEDLTKLANDIEKGKLLEGRCLICNEELCDHDCPLHDAREAMRLHKDKRMI